MSINQTFNSYYLEMFIEELKEEIIKLKQELRCEKNLKESAVKTVKELEEENRKLKSERDKWRGKYNRLKSEFNLLKNKI